MALSASQITSIRNQIGDNNSEDYDLDDTRLNTLYTEQSEDFGATLVAACRERLGILTNEVDTTTSGGVPITERRKQRYDMLKERCMDLAKLYGLDGAALSIGSIDYNLDTDMQDLDL